MKVVVLILLYIGVLFAKEYAVIGSMSMKKLSKSQVRLIYLKKMTMLHDTKLLPLNLSPKSPIRNSFEKKILKLNRSRLRAYWTKQHYLGHRPPKTQSSQESVIKYVQKVSGAIGYVEVNKVPENVKILYRWRE